MMNKLGLLLLLVSGSLAAQAVPTALALGAGDVTVEARSDGYHLFIRQIPGVSSVLLTEAYEMPDHKLATYALRSVGPNPVNDAEPRLLDGQFLKLPHHSLVSSSPSVHGTLGKVFEVVVPPVVEYGSQANPNSRYGKIDLRTTLSQVSAPVWFSIRTFSKAYADYSGTYKDNAFEMREFLSQVSRPTDDHYETNLRDGFARLGTVYPARDVSDALDRTAQSVGSAGGSVDLVLCLDTTKSMDKNLRQVKTDLVGLLGEEAKKYQSFRVGIVFYRDYMEEYLTQVHGFTTDLGQVQKTLETAVADGGGDIPEAVTEGVWAGLTGFDWKADHRLVVVLGDAPPHPAPRGDVTEDMVRKAAGERKVGVLMVMLPQTLP